MNQPTPAGGCDNLHRMPKMIDKDILAAIAKNEVVAVTLDTSVFDKYGDNLKFRVLLLVKQLPEIGIEVYLSEIVEKELAGHIADDATETQEKLRTALKRVNKRWVRDFDIAKLPKELALDEDPATEGVRQVASYVKEVNATILPALSDLAVGLEVLNRYFTVRVPFEGKKAKKSEFPDAFALVSLEAAAKNKGKLMLCVSGDNGWRTFAEESKYLVHVPDIETALSLFSKSGRETAEKAVARWREGQAKNLDDAIQTAIQQHIDYQSFDPQAESGVRIEGEPIGATLQGVDAQKAGTPIVVAADEEQVTFTIKAQAVIEFEASFSFIVKDAIDRDEVTIDFTTRYVEDTIEVELVITVDRADEEDFEILDIEVATLRSLVVDFGYMDPFEDENPE